jgi:formiminoglutamase
MNTPHFKIYSKSDILALTTLRRFETKLGEQVKALNGQGLEGLQQLDAHYVILGIPEDIGVQANLGIGGAKTTWIPFLQYFLNIQSNDFLSGDEIAVLGHFDFTDIQALIDTHAPDTEERTEAYRHAVQTIDEEVEKVIKTIANSGKIPVVIGGGHNNAYPLIKGTAKGLNQANLIPLPQINCINLDAHADYRPAEGRHSGNAFRYAEEDGFLQKYCIVGLQENSLQQNVWMDIVNNPFIDCLTFEDIFIHEKRTFHQAVSHAISFTDDNYTGIELDLDAVENVLSSALTPCGVSPVQARQYVNLCAAHVKACYLHICEGAATLASGRTDDTIGKLISLMVSDFIKMHGSR